MEKEIVKKLFFSQVNACELKVVLIKKRILVTGSQCIKKQSYDLAYH